MGNPRRINVVSVSVVVLLVAGVYCAWKLIPPYLQANDVDTELAAAKNELGRHDTRGSDDSRVAEVLGRARARLIKLGVDDPELEVGLARGDEKHTVYAKYRVKVKLLFGSVTLKFHRKVKMDAEKL